MLIIEGHGTLNSILRCKEGDAAVTLHNVPHIKVQFSDDAVGSSL